MAQTMRPHTLVVSCDLIQYPSVSHHTESAPAAQAPFSRQSAQRKPHPGVSHGYMERCPLPTAQRLGQSLVLWDQLRPALWVQVSHQGFHGATEGMLLILYAVLFK